MIKGSWKQSSSGRTRQWLWSSWRCCTESLEDDDENEVEVTVLEEVIKIFLVSTVMMKMRNCKLWSHHHLCLSWGHESTINNYDQDKRNIDKSSVNQIQNPLAPSQQSGQSLSHNRPDTDNSQTKGVKTKLCKNIAWVVGETETVYKLDTARQKMNTQQAPFTQTTIKTLHQCRHKSWLSTHHLRNSKGNRKSNTTLIMTVLKQV